MGLPVACVDVGIGNGVPAVDHHPASNVNAHMGCPIGVIGALKEDDVSGLCGAGRDDGELSAKGFRIQPAVVPAVAAVVDDPAHKTGAVKGRGRTAAAPDIGIPQIFLRLVDHIGEPLIGQRLAGNVVVQIVLIGVNVILKQVGLVALGLDQQSVALNLAIGESGVVQRRRDTVVSQRHGENMILI